MSTTVKSDQLQRFLFENLPVRGEMISLSQTYQSIIENHDYPNVVKKLLGELLATTSLLTATLKFEGDITLQLQGDGPLRLLVINGNNHQEMRGVARFSEEIDENMSLKELVGNGFLVMTIMPKNGQRYQGIVAIEYDSIAKCVEHYFVQSEQLLTRIFLFSDPDFKGGFAAGVLLQELPGEEKNPEEFERLCILTETLKADEMFTLSHEEVLHRLFHEDDVTVFDATPIIFKCSCNRARSENALLTLSDDALQELLADKDYIEMHCDYCNTNYSFNADEINRLREIRKHAH